MTAVEKKFLRMRKALNLELPDRVPMPTFTPAGGDYQLITYRPELYTTGIRETVEPGEVRFSTDGKKAYTADGGVWNVGDKELYGDEVDVLAINLEAIEVESPGSHMLSEMSRLYRDAAARAFPVPWHYGTVVTRAVIEFGWEPFLMASILDADRFGLICERFGMASLAVAEGWVQTPGVEFVMIHDDIAGTRGLLLRPEWYREYVFPLHRRIYDAIHRAGCKVLYVSDGNYLDVIDDLLDLGVDGLYIESTSMDPQEVMSRGGAEILYLVKSDARNMDFGTPETVYCELLKLRHLHKKYPGMLLYGGGTQKPECVEAFARYYSELLVYS